MTGKTKRAKLQAGADHDTPEAPNDQPVRLTFSSDKGASRSTWFAALLVVLIVGWMGSGFVIPSEDADRVIAREVPNPVAVAVATSRAQTVTQFYQAEGQALPDRDSMMRAETPGDIAEVLVRKGQDVSAGDNIARFDPTNNEADAGRDRKSQRRVGSRHRRPTVRVS